MSEVTQTSDDALMTEALARAGRGRGATSPNPMVGALVTQHGQVVGRGYHARAGGRHAEVVALDHPTMMKEADKLRAIADNVCIKVPLTSDGLKTCKNKLKRKRTGMPTAIRPNLWRND